MPLLVGLSRQESAPTPFRLPKGLSKSQRQRVYLQHRITLNSQGPAVGALACAWDELPIYMERSGAARQAADLRQALAQARLVGAPMGERSVDLAKEAALAPGAPLLGRWGLGSLVSQKQARDALLAFNRRLALGSGQPVDSAEVGLNGILPPPWSSLSAADLAVGETWAQAAVEYRVHCRPDGGWFVGETGVTPTEAAAFINQQGLLPIGEAAHAAPEIPVLAEWTARTGYLLVGAALIGALATYSSSQPTQAWIAPVAIGGGALMVVGFCWSLPARLARQEATGLGDIAWEYDAALDQKIKLLR